MTNDEIPNDERMTNDEYRMTKGPGRRPAWARGRSRALRHWEFVIPSSLGISSFVIATVLQGHRSRIQLDRLDDLFEVVADLYGAVGERGPLDAALAEDFVKGLLVGAVVRHRRGRVFELVAGENANDALARGNDFFLT